MLIPDLINWHVAYLVPQEERDQYIKECIEYLNKHPKEKLARSLTGDMMIIVIREKNGRFSIFDTSINRARME